MNEDKLKGYICDLDLSNSPKAQFVSEFNSWFMTEDNEKILSVLAPDIQWEMVGENAISGIEAVKDSFLPRGESPDYPSMETMVVEGIITHGREAVSYGNMTMTDGSRYKFTDILELKDLSKKPMIKKITSFVIKID